MDSQETLKGSLPKELSLPSSFPSAVQDFHSVFILSLLSLFPLINFSLLAVFQARGYTTCNRACRFFVVAGQTHRHTHTVQKKRGKTSLNTNMYVCMYGVRRERCEACKFALRGVEALCDSACGRIKLMFVSLSTNPVKRTKHTLCSAYFEHNFLSCGTQAHWLRLNTSLPNMYLYIYLFSHFLKQQTSSAFSKLSKTNAHYFPVDSLMD